MRVWGPIEAMPAASTSDKIGLSEGEIGMIREIQHAAVQVADLEEALGFYRLLGLDELQRPAALQPIPGAWLSAGRSQLHLVVDPEMGEAPGLSHVAFEVDGLDGVVGVLRARGLEVSEPTEVGGARQAFLRDPSGNLLELCEGPGR